MMLSRCLSGISLIILTQCLGLSVAVAQFSLIQESIIGEHPEDMASALTFPFIVGYDSSGHLYVSDKSAAHIKVFDVSGNMINTLGVRGQGPGEYQEIAHFTLNYDGELLVLDNINARLTLYDRNHDLADTVPFPDGKMPFIIKPLSDSLYVFGIMPRYANKEDIGVRRNIFYIYDKDLNPTGVNFGSTGNIWEVDTDMGQIQTRMIAINVSVINSQKFVIVPLYYEGNMLLCDGKGGVWSERKVIGNIPIGESYTLLGEEIIRNENSDRTNTVAYSGMAGRAIFKSRHYSLGVFPYESGFVHFSYRTVRLKQHELGVEIFDRDGNLLEYGIVDNPPLTGEYIQSVRFLAEHEGHFIASFNMGEDPVIVKYRLARNVP